MARRKHTSAMDALFELAAMLPWWVGVTLAALSYVVLHRVAAQTIPATTQAGQISGVVLQSMWKAAASIGQYALPMILLAGAAASALGRKQRKALVEQVRQRPTIDALDGLTWQQFEQLVGEGFRQRGYQVSETGGGGPDGGVDLVLRKGGEKFIVQCKQWRALQVGVDVARQLYGIIAATGATGGFVVTSGVFSADAEAFAQGRNIRLVNGKELIDLIRTGRRRKAR